MTYIPSPAIAIVGRHNSGKTTLIEQLIAQLVRRGRNVGSIKHHSHDNFEIDYPGKDSYRHREAGATETVIASPVKMARVKTLQHEVECSEIVRSMPGHDIIIVEGYRKSGLPTIELMRAGNPADMHVAKVFLQGARVGLSLASDFTQLSNVEDVAAASVAGSADATGAADALGAADATGAADAPDATANRFAEDISTHMPGSDTVAVITDIPQAREAADIFGIPCLAIDDISGIVDFLEKYYVRQKVSVVIQAGGESKRMGRSKATVPFNGQPLISRLVERVAPAADELIITTNEPENLGFLHEIECPLPEGGIKLVKDLHDVRGALQGLHTAFSSATNPFVAIVACDMVFASASLIVAESIEISETDADVVVPVNKHGFEPFHAIYRRQTCLEAAKRALESGSSRAQAIFEDPEIKVCEFPQTKVLEVEPRGGCFVNANTPEELARLEEACLDD